MEIRKVSETASKMTLAWDPVPGAAAGYRGRDVTVPKWTQTQQTQMTFAKGASVEIQALGVVDSGVYPPPEEPPPLETGNPYLDVTFINRRYYPATITVFESYTVDPRISASWGGLPAEIYDNPGAYGYTPTTSMSSDTSQRVHLATPPVAFGTQSWVSRQEVRTSDGSWGTGGNSVYYDKSTIRGDTSQTLNGAFQQGMIRWFSYDYLLPLNLNGDTFNFPASGHLTLMDLHETTTTAYQTWNVLDLGTVRPYASSHPKWLGMDAQALGNNNPAGYDYERFNYLQLTDSSGNRVAASYNVWHRLVVGIKFSENADGWVDIWHDGVNVLPQHARRTCFPGSSGVWWQAQYYKMYQPFGGGARIGFLGGANSGVVYFGRIRAGMTKDDVD